MRTWTFQAPVAGQANAKLTNNIACQKHLSFSKKTATGHSRAHTRRERCEPVRAKRGRGRGGMTRSVLDPPRPALAARRRVRSSRQYCSTVYWYRRGLKTSSRGTTWSQFRTLLLSLSRELTFDANVRFPRPQQVDARASPTAALMCCGCRRVSKNDQIVLPLKETYIC